MLRNTVSGSGGACTRSAKVSVQLRAVGAALAFERRHLRPVEANADGLAFLQRQPADIADDGRRPWRGSARHRSALVRSNTSHTVSARRNSAAGVGAAKENVTRRPSLSRRASTEPRARFFAPLSARSGHRLASQASPPPPAAGSCAGAAGFGASACIGSAGCTVSRLPPALRLAAPALIFAAAGAACSVTGVAFSARRHLLVGLRRRLPGLISILACSAIASEVTGGKLRRLLRRHRFVQRLAMRDRNRRDLRGDLRLGRRGRMRRGRRAALGTAAFPPAGRRRR